MLILPILPFVFLSFYALDNPVLTHKLPFDCPYKTPDGSPPPSATGQQGAGLFSTLYEDGRIDESSSNVYSEYRAALALVPCDAQPISVFTNPLVNGEFAISVIYLYDKQVDDLKKWLR